MRSKLATRRRRRRGRGRTWGPSCSLGGRRRHWRARLGLLRHNMLCAVVKDCVNPEHAGRGGCAAPSLEEATVLDCLGCLGRHMRSPGIAGLLLPRRPSPLPPPLPRGSPPLTLPPPSGLELPFRMGLSRPCCAPSFCQARPLRWALIGSPRRRWARACRQREGSSGLCQPLHSGPTRCAVRPLQRQPLLASELQCHFFAGYV